MPGLDLMSPPVTGVEADSWDSNGAQPPCLPRAILDPGCPQRRGVHRGLHRDFWRIVGTTENSQPLSQQWEGEGEGGFLGAATS